MCGRHGGGSGGGKGAAVAAKVCMAERGSQVRIACVRRSSSHLYRARPSRLSWGSHRFLRRQLGAREGRTDALLGSVAASMDAWLQELVARVGEGGAAAAAAAAARRAGCGGSAAS